MKRHRFIAQARIEAIKAVVNSEDSLALHEKQILPLTQAISQAPSAGFFTRIVDLINYHLSTIITQSHVAMPARQ